VIVKILLLGLSPQELVHTAAYSPGALIVVLVPVVLFDHFTCPEQSVAVRVTDSVPQISNLEAEIVGAVGVTPVPIVIGAETADVPQVLVQVAV
jgi:hypothetical protein